MGPETQGRRTYSAMAGWRKHAATEAVGTGKFSSKRPETTIGQLEAMLRRSDGATIAQIVSALGL
jgi:hypothetical protein